MLKTIPKSSISKRAFRVNKAWTVTSDDYPIISGSFTNTGTQTVSGDYNISGSLTIGGTIVGVCV